MKYRYFPEYGKELPLPEVEQVMKPMDTPDCLRTENDWKIYNDANKEHFEWLSSGIHVPDEHLWYFEGVDRDGNEFEKVKQVEVIIYGKAEWINAEDHTYNNYENKRIAAIPKAEESKEQEDSPIEVVRDILNYIYASDDNPYWTLKEVQMRLEKLITQ